LASVNQGLEAGDKIGFIRFQPFQKGPAVVQGDAKSRVLFEGFEKGAVTLFPPLLEDPVEIPNGLVIMNGKKQIDDFHTYCFGTSHLPHGLFIIPIRNDQGKIPTARIPFDFQISLLDSKEKIELFFGAG
jgi:hypothetical protein